MKKLLYILLTLGGSSLCAQSISPEVLNAAGSHRPLGGNGVSVTDNVGEPFTETLGPSSNALLTQGFVQPEAVGVYGFSVTVFKNDVTCADKSDGSISTAITALSSSGYKVTYVWTPSVVCPGNNCPVIDSLDAGKYDLKVIFTYTTLANVVKNDTVKNIASQFVTDVNGPCKVKIFNGVNVNGGNNGHLHIDNISEFPNNRLTIYNRWGAQLYDEKGYDNTSKFWPSADDLNKLQPSTYFYVLDLGDGSKPIKGWVELVKN